MLTLSHGLFRESDTLHAWGPIPGLFWHNLWQDMEIEMTYSHILLSLGRKTTVITWSQCYKVSVVVDGSVICIEVTTKFNTPDWDHCFYVTFPPSCISFYGWQQRGSQMLEGQSLRSFTWTLLRVKSTCSPPSMMTPPCTCLWLFLPTRKRRDVRTSC